MMLDDYENSMTSIVRGTAADIQGDLSARQRSCIRALLSLEKGAGSDSAVSAEGLLESLRDWASSVNEGVGAASLIRFQENLGPSMGLLRSVPAIVRTGVPAEFWMRRLPTRLDRARRSGYRLFLRAARGFFLATAFLKSSRQAQSLGGVRKIALRSLFYIHAMLPFERFMIGELSRRMYSFASWILAWKGQLEAGAGGSGTAYFEELFTAAGAALIDIDAQETESSARFETFWTGTYAQLQAAWGVAGTPLFPYLRDSPGRMRTAKRRAARARRGMLSRWQAFAFDTSRDLILKIDALLLITKATRFGEEAERALDARIREKVLPLLEDCSRLLGDLLDRLSFSGEDEAPELKGLIVVEGHRAVRQIRDQILKDIATQFERETVEQLVSGAFVRLLDYCRDLHFTHRAVKLIGLQDELPSWWKVPLSLRPIVEDRTRKELEWFRQRQAPLVAGKIATLKQDVSEVDQIVEFNLEAVLRLIRSEDGAEIASVRGLVAEGLARALRTVKNISAQSESLRGSLLGILHSFETELTAAIRVRSSDRSLIRNILRSSLLFLHRRATEALQRSTAVAGQFAQGAVTLGSRVHRSAQSRYLSLRRMARIGEPERHTANELTRNLTEFDRKLADLPPVYRLLFGADPLADERFFGGRETELEVLRNGYAAWQAGHHIMTAIVGENGSGRTTLLNFARQRPLRGAVTVQLQASPSMCTGDTLVRFLAPLGATDEDSIDSLEEKVRSSADRRVCLLEDVQRLFVRTIVGFDMLERLLLFMARTSGSIFWVVTCSLYSWRYLDQVLGLSGYFNETIVLKGMDAPELAQLVLKRHRVSGYTLRFEPSDRGEQSRRFLRLRSDRARQEYLREVFFRRLSEIAEGNIGIALLLWLQGVQGFERNEVVLSSDIGLDEAVLFAIPAEDQFTLAALILHEYLRPARLAEVFNEPIQDCRLRLDRLKNRGILQETRFGYNVHPLAYRSVARVLRSRNLVR
jgi:hypothetical protein